MDGKSSKRPNHCGSTKGSGTPVHIHYRSLWPFWNASSHFETLVCDKAVSLLKNRRRAVLCGKAQSPFYSFLPKKTNHGSFFLLGANFKRSRHAYDVATRIPQIRSNWDMAHVTTIVTVPTVSMQALWRANRSEMAKVPIMLHLYIFLKKWMNQSSIINVRDRKSVLQERWTTIFSFTPTVR